MSSRHLTPLRPAIGHALRSSTLPHGPAQLESLRAIQMARANSLRAKAIFIWYPSSRRHQSTPNSPQSPNERPDRNGSKPRAKVVRRPPTVREILRKGMDFSWVRGVATKQGVKKLYNDSPGELILAITVLAGIGGCLIYTVYLYFTYYNAPQFTRFPPEIANSLRRALYFTNMKPDPDRALKYYKQALEQCKEHRLDPFSDEVLGIRIQVTYWLEKIGNYPNAISVLTHLVNDCQKWIDTFEKQLAEGILPQSGVVRVPKSAVEGQKAEGGEKKEEGGEKKGEGEEQEEEMVELENLWHKRTRILSKIIATKVKLGELYGNEHVMEAEKSRVHLIQAVEALLKEFRRRRDEGVKEGEGPWMTVPEMGGALESLASSYEKNSQFQLAVPLFFQALRMCESPCHRPVIMNNLAISFAQHPALPVLVTPQEDPASDGAARPFTKSELLEAAHNWAQNAYMHAKDVKGDDRTIECDEACAVSLCNLGQIAAMLGDTKEARRRFEKCIEMSKSIDFPDGVKQAKVGLKSLGSGP